MEVFTQGRYSPGAYTWAEEVHTAAARTIWGRDFSRLSGRGWGTHQTVHLEFSERTELLCDGACGLNSGLLPWQRGTLDRLFGGRQRLVEKGWGRFLRRLIIR